MATIYSDKNQISWNNESFTNQINNAKIQNKLYVASNIFASQYQIKNVHVIDGSSILYEVLKDNKMHIIHQIVLWKEDFDSTKIMQKISKLCELSFVEKVFFEDADLDEDKTNISNLIQLLQKNDQIKIKFVLQDSLCIQPQKNQNSSDLINTSNDFIQFIKQFNQLKLKYPQLSQNTLVFKNQTTKQYVFYPLDYEVSQQRYLQSLEVKIRLYLTSKVAKNIKDYLNLKCKKHEFLFQVYQNKFINPNNKEFIDLLKSVLQNKEKYTQKMLICYIEILKQKHLKSVEQDMMSKFLQNKKSSFQPPQRDISPTNFVQHRQKQSNSFSNFNETQLKSLSRKLKLEKQKNITGDNFRHSQGKKSSSIISMSPNRKNRKYLKYTSTGLFSNSKQNLQRSSSSSFLMKTTQSFYQNTGNSFYNKNASNTAQNYRSQNNFFKKPENQNVPLKPESQIKSYLQTMGFGNKNQQKIQKIEQRKNSHTLHHQNEKFGSSYRQSYQISAKQIQSQQVFCQKNQNIDRFEVNLESNLNVDDKKLRLKQSLSLLQKKRNSQNYTSEGPIPEKVNTQFQTKNQVQYSPKQDYPGQYLIPKKQQNPSLIKNDLQNLNKLTTFKISHQNCMDINIRATKKQKSLKIQRSTVMVMHIVNFERKQTQREKSYFSQQATDKSIESSIVENIQVRKQKDLSFKPSLASLKKQKGGQKSERHEKITPNYNQEKLSSYGQQKSTQIKKQQQKYNDIQQNLSLNHSKTNFISEKQVLSSISQSSQILTEQLSKNTLESSQNKQNQINNKLILSKQFLKQIFLFINSQNKTFVDLLGSKLSYQITFYAFYINYFKLNVTKTTTKQAIEKMILQIKDYESKIMESEKFNSIEKMIPQYEPFVKRLLNLKMQKFMENYWRKQEFSQKEKESITKISQQIDSLTSEILKVTLRIIINRLKSYKSNEKQVTFVLRSLKICSTICQLIYCISNKLLSMTVTQLKKITQTASSSQLGYEKNLLNNLSKSQGIIQMYTDQMKQYQSGQQKIIDKKSEIKKIQALLTQLQK